MIEVTIIGNEFDHIKLGDGEEVMIYLYKIKSKSLMAYNATCKEIEKKEINNIVKYANILADHIRNYADDIIQ
jgi:hypothetical protein